MVNFRRLFTFRRASCASSSIIPNIKILFGRRRNASEKFRRRMRLTTKVLPRKMGTVNAMMKKRGLRGLLWRWDAELGVAVIEELKFRVLTAHLSTRVYNQRAIVDNARRTGEGENLLHRVLHNYTAGRNCCVRSGGGARLGLVI